MKKFGKLAVLAAMVLALACFISCDNPAGGSGDSTTGGNGSTQQTGGSTTGGDTQQTGDSTTGGDTQQTGDSTTGGDTQQTGGNGNAYANTTWTSSANVYGCSGTFTLTFDNNNGFVFAEEWSSEVWPVGEYPADGSMSGTYKVEDTKLVLTVKDTTGHGGGPTEDYEVGDEFELQISDNELQYEAEDEYGSYTFTKSNNTQSGDNNESDNGDKDPATPPESESNENLVATYVCAEPQGSKGAYSFTLKFYNDESFSATYTKGTVTGEISTGSYTGNPANDGDIVFKVEDYVDFAYVLAGYPQISWKWEGKTIADQNINITGGKGSFDIWDRGYDDFTRQE